MEISNLFGLPAHPLIVHAVVVLVPLVALGAVGVVLWRGLRDRVGWLVVAGAATTAVLVPLATVALTQAAASLSRRSAGRIKPAIALRTE